MGRVLLGQSGQRSVGKLRYVRVYLMPAGTTALDCDPSYLPLPP